MCIIAGGNSANVLVEDPAIHHAAKQDSHNHRDAEFQKFANHWRIPFNALSRTARESPPSLTILGGLWVTSRIVEPSAAGKIPPSTSISSSSPNCSITSGAEVVEGFPDLFALVAVMGLPKRRTNSTAKSARGQRTPMVPLPAVTNAGTSSAAGRTKVSGPGQKRSARAAATPARL